MGHGWIVKCKKCGADITYKFGAEHHVPETVIGEPPKPMMLRQTLKCSICKTDAEYTRQDLQFRLA
jgi:hypothetical protein